MSRQEAAEAAIAEIARRFPGWQPTPTMLGYARACMGLYQPPPPLPDRARGLIDASIGRLNLGANNWANGEELREWCASIASDLRMALEELGERPPHR